MDWETVAGWLFTVGCVFPLAIVGVAILMVVIGIAWDSFK